jgi:hypothetical protein
MIVRRHGGWSWLFSIMDSRRNIGGVFDLRQRRDFLRTGGANHRGIG